MRETAHFVRKTSFPENWILGAKGIVGLFYTVDGLVIEHDVLVIFLHKYLSKISRSSMPEKGMHVTIVETRTDGMR